MVVFYAPIAAGVVSGAFRETAASGPIAFDGLTLALSAPEQSRSRRFDGEAGQLALRNVSLRYLISLAYPRSTVSSDPDLIDGASYDIDARWHDGGRSERHIYRALLERIVQANSNLQIHVDDRCESGCP
jgi:uncharacterized protein (TIGR03435 family)